MSNHVIHVALHVALHVIIHVHWLLAVKGVIGGIFNKGQRPKEVLYSRKDTNHPAAGLYAFVAALRTKSQLFYAHSLK
jgi:hypothetical protein